MFFLQAESLKIVLEGSSKGHLVQTPCHKDQLFLNHALKVTMFQFIWKIFSLMWSIVCWPCEQQWRWNPIFSYDSENPHCSYGKKVQGGGQLLRCVRRGLNLPGKDFLGIHVFQTGKC